jgi:hypothetical protein
MDKTKVIFSSKPIELSETKTYLELKDLVCYYDAPNLNGVELPSDTAEEYAQGLVDMPVYACYKANQDGEPSFSGHCAYIDEDGELAFATIPIGVHTAVSIENHDVVVGDETKNLPCLIASQRIWTRNKNAIAAVKRLYELGELHNSWEIETDEYTFSNGIKHITKYTFLGNTFLGWDNGVDPAYGKSAKVFSLSSKNVNENELMIAEAIAKDVSENLKNKNKEDSNLENKNGVKSTEDKPVVAEKETELDKAGCGKKKCADDTEKPEGKKPEDKNLDNENPEDKKPDIPKQDDTTKAGCGKKKCADAASDNNVLETSALTSDDLYKALQDAVRAQLNPVWGYVAFIFPEDHKVWAKLDATNDLVFKQFDYVVTEDTVTVSNPTDIDLGSNISEIASISAKVVALTDALAEANKQVKDLEPFKAEHEQAEKDKAEKEHKDAEEALAQYAKDSDCFNEDELASEEMQKLISTLNKSAVAQKIADKVIESMNTKKVKQVSETKRVDISSAATTDDSHVDYSVAMREFLNK